MPYGVVYCIRSRISGREYIGQTIQKLSKRIAHHKWLSTLETTNSAITAAIHKYGWECFEADVICECESQEELDSMELLHIEKRGTISPHGYNLRAGGNGRGGCSDETRMRISRAHRGRVLSEEHRRNLSEAHKGNRWSEEHRRKASKFMKGKRLSPKAYANALKSCSKDYVLVGPDGREIHITNMAAFCRDNKLSKSKMSELACGRRDRYRGYRRPILLLETEDHP